MPTIFAGPPPHIGEKAVRILEDGSSEHVFVCIRCRNRLTKDFRMANTSWKHENQETFRSCLALAAMTEGLM